MQLKKLLALGFCILLICKSATGQATAKSIIGNWKLIKMEVDKEVAFDLDNLLTSYQQFFKRQRQQVYKGNVTVDDSLRINLQFEQLINDVRRMFMEFKEDSQYLTNKYDSKGALTADSETGTYRYNAVKREIVFYTDGRKDQVTRYKLLKVDKDQLIIQSVGLNPAIISCRKDVIINDNLIPG